MRILTLGLICAALVIPCSAEVITVGGTAGWILRKQGTGSARYLNFWAGHSTTNAYYATPAGSLASDTWHHVAAVWDGAAKTCKIYIDGFESSYDFSTAGEGSYNSDASYDKEIGRMAYMGGIQFFDGKIDDVKIFDEALTPSEIQELYGSIGYWRMDDDAEDTTVLDSSSNGNDGTAQQNTSILHTAGQIDGALTFDGVRDYINLGSPAALDDLPADDFTVSAWIYDESTTSKGIIIGVFPNDSGGADFDNIQDAIDYSSHGDTIEVWPGSYGERINFYGMSITITSTDPNDLSVVEATVIDAGSSGNAVTFDSGEDATSVLVGFTVQNGDRGIYCYYSDPAIEKCLIKSNNESAVYGVEAQPTIAHCRISENGGSADHKAVYDCDGEIFDCIVNDNTGRGMADCDGPISGCAISANSSFGLEMCAGIIANSVISGNGDTGIVSGDGQIIVNCTIVCNKGNGYTYGEGADQILSSNIIVLNSGYGVQGSATLAYNNIWANTSGSYDGVPPEPTDIHKNPLFAENGFWNGDPNWVQGDYHLKSEVGRWDQNAQTWVIDDVSSPCIDAGHPAYPTDYEPYPDGNIINQGVYGGTEQASKSPNGQYTYCTGPITGDIDEDCRVDVSDFAMVAANWLQTEELEPNMVIQEWADRYDGPDNNDDDALAIAIDSSGSIYVTGWSEGTDTGKDYVTIKYDSSGTRLWADRYNGPGNDYDRAVAIAADTLENVYVTGSSKGTGGKLDYATIKYDPNGTRLWVVRYNGSADGHDTACAVGADSWGDVYVTGWSEGAGGDKDYVTIKYDPNGTQLWAVRYDNPTWGLDDEANAMAIDAVGNVYVTGSSNEDAFTDHYTTIKYDPNGNEIWVAHYSFTDDEAKAIAIDSLGNVCVAGNSNGANGRPDYATIKYDPNGNELWVARYNGPGNDGDYLNGIVIDSVDNIYVTGSSEGAEGNMDYATIKYDPNGSELWVARYNGPGNGHDYGLALALDGLDNIYVSGDSSGVSGDYATVKYDPNGNELGAARYDGPGNGDDSPSDIVIDSLDNVYVTGWSQDSGYYDYLTIKYAPSYTCATIITGDFNNDCKVNLADFAIMSLHWLECNLEPQEACWE